MFASSGGAIYGDAARLPATERTAKRPASPYGITKKIVEDYFRWFHETYGLSYVLLAMANVYGPRQDPGLEGGVTAIFARAMIEGRRPIIFGDGRQTRDFVYVEDAVDAFQRAADSRGGLLLNIASGRETRWAGSRGRPSRRACAARWSGTAAGRPAEPPASGRETRSAA
ncbi:MAG: NAD-dependent epimerase/dehydratase [Acidobacteria bacterium]|nr:NAD-dependent epimerase/dehydratase [Acidobacteriota bacterium]